jgi:hypothetical protein
LDFQQKTSKKIGAKNRVDTSRWAILHPKPDHLGLNHVTSCYIQFGVLQRPLQQVEDPTDK